jgi:parallel beta-helix repeat protein
MLSYLSGVNETNLKNNNMNNNDELGIYYPNAEMGKIKFTVPKITPPRVIQNTVAKITPPIIKTAVTTIKSNVQDAVKSTQDAFKGINQDLVKHNIAKVSLAIPRGAFLVLLRLGGALEQTPVKINLAKKMAEGWASKGNDLKKKWYELGGDPQELVNIINIASNKPTISGMSYLGVEPVTTAAATTGTVAAATPIIASITAILGTATAFLSDPKNKEIIGIGKAIAGKALDEAKKNNPAQAQAVQSLTDDVKAVIPMVTIPVTTAQVTSATNNATGVITDVKTQLAPPQPTKDNKMLYIIGGVAVVGLGALFLMKKK